MRQKSFSPISILIILGFLLYGCGENIILAPTKTATAETILTLTPSTTPIPPTVTPSIVPTVTKSKTPRVTATRVVTPTPIFDSIASLAPGMYIEIKKHIKDQDGSLRYETGSITIDGIYKAHLFGNGGPIDPTGKKMVVWNLSAPYETYCSRLEILDLTSQKIISGHNHPTGYTDCLWLNWSPDGKFLFLSGI